MADDKNNLKHDNRRDRIEASATSADVVAGMAAAGIGLVLASDDAIAHMKAAIDPDRREADGRNAASDPASTHTVADHAAFADAPVDQGPPSGPNEQEAANPAADPDRPGNADPLHAADDAVGHVSMTGSSEAVNEIASNANASSNATGDSVQAPHVTESVSSTAHSSLDTMGNVVSSTLDQIDATIASATGNIVAVGSSIGATVSNLADTLSGVGQSIMSHVADLPSTLLGAQPAVASVDHVFTNAFHESPVAHVADSIDSFGLSDSLPGFEDFTPINLGFIGQSYTDQIELGGQTPGGMLHGLV